MTKPRNVKFGTAAALVVLLIAAISIVVRGTVNADKTEITAYFDNSNGIFVGDEIRILGVPVGKIDKIEPQPQRVKISFWVDGKYEVPADARAAILSPSLVTSRAIQLVPVYTGGPTMSNDAVIPEDRTAVPVEWDDFRAQLEKLTQTLQPTQPGGVSSLGAFINTAADNLRGQGPNIRQTVIELSQAFSALGDHSNDIFGTVKHLSTLVSALQASTELMQQLNQNLAAVTGLLSNDPNEVGAAVNDLNTAVSDVASFIADNRESIGTASDKLASITQALTDSLDDIKQTLHLAPTAFQNFMNIYQPAQNSLTGALVVNNFANPISFLCGAIQAASRLGAEQSAKLCVQYLAPIIKNRQYNFPPIGVNPFVGATARPNEITYSEDWMRPNFVPPQPQTPQAPLSAEAPASSSPDTATVLPTDAVATNPADGLPGLMVPPGGGS